MSTSLIQQRLQGICNMSASKLVESRDPESGLSTSCQRLGVDRLLRCTDNRAVHGYACYVELKLLKGAPAIISRLSSRSMRHFRLQARIASSLQAKYVSSSWTSRTQFLDGPRELKGTVIIVGKLIASPLRKKLIIRPTLHGTHYECNDMLLVCCQRSSDGQELMQHGTWG